jgi:ATP-binding cassette, subfamily C, bacterial
MPSTASREIDPAQAGHASERLAPAGSTWQTMLRLLRFMVGVDARMLGLTVATALASSLSEGIGLVLLLPLLSVAGMSFPGESTAGRLAFETQRILVWTGIPHSMWLPVVLGMFLAMAGLRSVLRRAQSIMAFTTMTEIELTLRRRVYESVVKAQWGYLVRQRAGKLTHLLTEELRRCGETILVLLSIISAVCLTLLYLAIALKLSVLITVMVVAIGGALMLLQRRSIERTRTSGEDLWESVGEVYAATAEHLLNLKSVKTYNAEDRDVKLFADLCDDVARHTANNAKHQAASSFRFEVGSLVALGLVIFLVIGVLHVQATTMLLLLAVFTRLMPQLANVQEQVQQIASTLPSFDHVLAIEAECRINADPLTLGGGAGVPVAAAPLALRREFRLENIWFAYNGATDRRESESVLRGLDLSIAAGTLTAIVGPSGAGKSTIADVVNGLLTPTRGRLILDGWPLDRNEMQQWRRRVGYVGQETVLFHKSVRDNLLWAQPKATEDELREALQLAAADFVWELPGGLESVVGDRGILLSSGQRQRISLARAMLRKPALLILDEATNALDVENEARILDAILEAIRTSKRGSDGWLTVLMIAHRHSAIRRADRIFELDGGRVTRSGTWKEFNSLA